MLILSHDALDEFLDRHCIAIGVAKVFLNKIAGFQMHFFP